MDIVAAELPLLWISSRAVGLAAWLASSLVVILGLVSTSGVLRKGRSVASVRTIHRTMAAATLGLAIGHFALLVPDPYAKLTLLDGLIPGLAPNHRLATALGTLSLLVLSAVFIASLNRRRLSPRAWRVVHTTAFLVWPMATAHYIVMGTDAMQWWSLGMIAAVVATVVVLLVLRSGGAATAQSTATLARSSVGTTADSVRNRGSSNVVTMMVVGRANETTDSVSFYLRPSAATSGHLNFTPGQFLTLRVPGPLGTELADVARCYSVSNYEPTTGTVRITVKRVPGGYASNWLCDHLQVGAALDVIGPSGSFTYVPTLGETVFFAAGSGITPIASMITAALAQPGGRMTLFYANRDAASVIFASELAALAQAYPGQLRVVHWWESERGLPTAEALRSVLRTHRSPEPAQVYVCGPAPFISAVRDAAAGEQWPAQALHVEAFASLTRNPFATLERAPVKTAAEPAAAAEVVLDGEVHSVAWHPDDTLLDALLDAGIDPPRSCMSGQCGTCACVVVAGEVDMPDTGFLDADEIADGVVLSCQTRPLSKELTVHF